MNERGRGFVAAPGMRRKGLVRGAVGATSEGRRRAWVRTSALGILMLAVLVMVPLRVLKIGGHVRPHAPVPRAREGGSLAFTDRFGDGTPDFLRLTDPADQAAFRRWFTAIAEFEAARPASEVPAEITDCASLLRFSYREALKRHDAEWVMATGIEVPAQGDVRAWHYPDTPLGMGLFRVTPGPFKTADVTNGAFAQFADAKTLVERNAYPVSRDVRAALPGDLLFWRQFGQSSSWHSMIVLDKGEVVYDTGPDHPPHAHGPARGGPGDHGKPGELRRVRIAELLEHPDARWRPVEGNPNFLGVYRWNILRGSE